MVDINQFDSKSNTKVGKANFTRYPSKKKLSFEQSLVSKDLSSFSTACVRGKLYPLIQSGQNSSFSSLNKAKNDLSPERMNQLNELLDSQHDFKFARLTFHHPEENEEKSPESEVVMELSEEVFSHSHSLIDDNESNKNELSITSEIQDYKQCVKCSCFIF